MKLSIGTLYVVSLNLFKTFVFQPQPYSPVKSYHEWTFIHIKETLKKCLFASHFFVIL